MTLTVLKLEFNMITSIEVQLWPEGLIELSLKGNQIARVGIQWWPCNIETLDLSDNNMASITSEMLQGGSGVRKIDLSNNRLTTVDGVDWPNQVTELNLENNLLVSLPEAPAWPRNLLKLVLNNNPFDQVFATAIFKESGDDLPGLTRGLQCEVEEFEVAVQLQPWTCRQTDACLTRSTTTSAPALAFNHFGFRAYLTDLVTREGLGPLQPLLPYASDPRYAAAIGRAAADLASITDNDIDVLLTIPEASSFRVAFERSAFARATPPPFQQQTTTPAVTASTSGIQDDDDSCGACNAATACFTNMACAEFDEASSSWGSIYTACNGGAAGCRSCYPASPCGLDGGNAHDSTLPAALLDYDGFKAFISAYVAQNGVAALAPLMAYASDPRYAEAIGRAATDLNSLTDADIDALLGIPEVQALAVAYQATMATTTSAAPFDYDGFKAFISAYVAQNGVAALAPLMAYASDPRYAEAIGRAATDLNSLTDADIDALLGIPEVQALAGAYQQQQRGGTASTVATVASFVPSNLCEEMAVTPPTVQCPDDVADGPTGEEPGWTCTLTIQGERLVQSLPAYREAMLALSDEGYLVFYQVAIPITIIVTAFGYIFGRHRGVAFWVFFFLALFDLCTDWAFWNLELSNEGFRNAYECIPTDSLTRCAATDQIYDCASHGLLNHPCRGNPAAIGDNPAHECECNGHTCFEGCLLYNDSLADWIEMPPDYQPSQLDIINERVFCIGEQCGIKVAVPGNTTRTVTFSMELYECSSYGTTGQFHDAPCGFAQDLNPEATGGNECECHDHTCEAVPNSGVECKGAYGGDYSVLLYSCMVFCLVATFTWLAHWRIYFPPLPRSEGTWFESVVGGDMSETGVVRMMFATVLLEDVPMLVYQSIYISVMDIGDSGVVVFSVFTTVFSFSLGVLVLANAHGEHIENNGGRTGKLFVQVFSCCGYIPVLMVKYSPVDDDGSEQKKHSISLPPEWGASSVETSVTKVPKEDIADHNTTWLVSELGIAVTVRGYGRGVLCFVGRHAVHGSKRLGIRLTEAIGKNNGTINGYRYFGDCAKGHGVLVKPDRVRKLVLPRARSRSMSINLETPANVSTEPMDTATYELTSFDRKQAERHLKDMKDGAFVLRPTSHAVSTHKQTGIGISVVKHGKVAHIRILSCNNAMEYFVPGSPMFDSIDELLDGAQSAAWLGVRLLPPVTKPKVAKYERQFTREQTEQFLNDTPVGSFVLRPSKSVGAGKVLSYVASKGERPTHLKLDVSKSGQIQIKGSSNSFSSTSELIKAACKTQVPGIRVTLQPSPPDPKSAPPVQQPAQHPEQSIGFPKSADYERQFTREQTEQFLNDTPVGSFVLRPSKSVGAGKVLSYVASKGERPTHLKLDVSKSGQIQIKGSSNSFSSTSELIKAACKTQVPGIRVTLQSSPPDPKSKQTHQPHIESFGFGTQTVYDAERITLRDDRQSPESGDWTAQQPAAVSADYRTATILDNTDGGVGTETWTVRTQSITSSGGGYLEVVGLDKL